jgi:porin
MSNLDLTADWNIQPGWEAFGYVLVNTNGGFSQRYAGDLQTVSNIDAVPGARLFEAWVRRSSGDGRNTTTFGLINLNSLFDVQPTGSLFLNASHGIGPDYSQSGPSIFPVSSLGLVHEWRSASGETRLRAAIFDGEAGNPHNAKVFTDLSLSSRQGYHVVAEAERVFTGGFVKAGAWAYNRGADRLDGGGIGGRDGAYIQAGLELTHEADAPDQGLSGWVRAGQANPDVFAIKAYRGGGLVYTGLLPHRDADRLGVAIAIADMSAAWRAVTPVAYRREINIETSYQAVLCDGLMLQPDLQYIRHPGALDSQKDAFAVTLRVKLTPKGCAA